MICERFWSLATVNDLLQRMIRGHGIPFVLVEVGFEGTFNKRWRWLMERRRERSEIRTRNTIDRIIYRRSTIVEKEQERKRLETNSSHTESERFSMSTSRQFHVNSFDRVARLMQESGIVEELKM